ncbi:hypothetical protein PV703_24735 [Streptomyces sp. ME01-24h]|nr:hypothetical protein [Streptomyces sp. ME19-03-3]MDX3214916.1 hypothetical protein [Streptomyces sp. ME02-6991-2B]MDX3356457.1 hypothetical protein [Streptomyces sp. ME01-24h]
MRKRIATTTLLFAVAGTALSGCGSSKDTAATAPEAAASAPSAVAQAEQGEGLVSAGIPAAPTGAERAALIAALQAINPDFAKDPDKAVDAARNQCAAVNSNSPQADAEAAQRFTYHGNALTDAQGKAINDALKRLDFCAV